MPDELAPGLTACAACGRVVENEHVNSSGRCSECAGLKQDTIEARASGEIEPGPIDPGELAPADALDADDGPKRRRR